VPFAVYEWGRGSADFTLMGIQLIAVLFIFSWTFTIMGSYFYFLNFMGWLRIDPLEEEVGMDISRHKGSAYDMPAPDQDSVNKLNQLNEDRSQRSMSNRFRTNSESDKKMTDDAAGVQKAEPEEVAPIADAAEEMA